MAVLALALAVTCVEIWMRPSPPELLTRQRESDALTSDFDLKLLAYVIHEYCIEHQDRIPEVDSRSLPNWIFEVAPRAGVSVDSIVKLSNRPWAYRTPKSVVGKSLSALKGSVVLVETVDMERTCPRVGVTVEMRRPMKRGWARYDVDNM